MGQFELNIYSPVQCSTSGWSHHAGGGAAGGGGSALVLPTTTFTIYN